MICIKWSLIFMNFKNKTSAIIVTFLFLCGFYPPRTRRTRHVSFLSPEKRTCLVFLVSEVRVPAVATGYHPSAVPY